MTSDAITQDTPVKSEENIICGCTSLSLAALRRKIAKNPALSFEDLIAETGAGTKCTACLLDLEYHFVETQRAPGTGPAIKWEDDEAASESISLKQRIYRWLDRMSPLVPYPFSNTVPVVYGPGIEEWIWITNRSLLFDGSQCAPETRIDLVIRDAGGRIVRVEKKSVMPETTWRFDVSAPLAEALPPPPAGQLGIGSVEIRRRSVTPGIRGTTRPQIEIVTAKAACAVHSQALSGAGQRWFGCVYRPEDDRVLFSLLNGRGQSTDIEISYPIGVPGIEPTVRTFTLPPHGAALHELELTSEATAAVGASAMTVTWRAKTSHKVWVLCASRNLDRISIDHV